MFRRSILLLVASALSIVGLTAPAHAVSTHEVTNLDSTGAGSFQQAIIDANSDSDESIIDFRDDLTGVITLPPFTEITRPVTIQGPSTSLVSVRVDPSNPSGILGIRATAQDVEINNLNFVNGQSVNNYGGAIYTEANLTLDDCDFTNNSAFTSSSTDIGGGAISTYAPTGSITVTVIDSEFIGNFARNDSTDPLASASGGAIMVNQNVALFVYTSYFDGNFAVGNMAVGGAITASTSSTLTVTNSSIRSSSARSKYANTPAIGGAINSSATYNAIETTSFINNRAVSEKGDARGGAFAVLSGGHLQMIDANLFRANKVESGSSKNAQGGAVFAQGRITVSGDVEFLSNSAIAGDGDGVNGDGGDASGGAIAVDLSGQALDVAGSVTMSGNSALGGEGIGVGEGGAALGGAIYSLKPVSIGPSSIFTDNVTMTDGATGSSVRDASAGGAIWTYGALNVDGSTFSDNTSTTINVDVVTASAIGRGGAIYLGTPTATSNSITSSTFDGNAANGVDPGPGINSGGGAIFNVGGDLTLANSTLSANTTNANVGGLFIYSGADSRILNVTADGNIGGPNFGGAISSMFSGVTVSNSILSNSTGKGDCGGINVTWNVDSTNNLIEDADSECNELIANNGLSTNPQLELLSDYGGLTETMALKSISPAINAGSSLICTAAPVNSLDQRGVPRTDGCDIGAFEYVAPAPTPDPEPTPSPTTTPTPGPSALLTPEFANGYTPPAKLHGDKQTVIAKQQLTTTSSQNVSVSVKGSPKTVKSTKKKKVKTFQVKRKNNGYVAFVPKAGKKLTVTITWTAPGTSTYKAFEFTKTYVVKRK